MNNNKKNTLTNIFSIARPLFITCIIAVAFVFLVAVGTVTGLMSTIYFSQFGESLMLNADKQSKSAQEQIDESLNIGNSFRGSTQSSNSEALALILSRCGTSCLLDSHLFRTLISPDFYEQGMNNYIGKIVDADEIARKAYLQDMTVLKEAAIICRDKPKLCENK